jgi:hypothetical protein
MGLLCPECTGFFGQMFVSKQSKRNNPFVTVIRTRELTTLLDENVTVLQSVWFIDEPNMYIEAQKNFMMY